MTDATLPLEIWTAILCQCSHASHLNLRLVNKFLSDVATPHAFSSLYIGWLPEYFEKLLSVASSRFNVHVKGLCFETTLMERPWSESHGSAETWETDLPDPTDVSWINSDGEEVCMNPEEYLAYLHQQQSQYIDNSDIDDNSWPRPRADELAVALSSVLRELPNITSVEAVNGSNLPTEYDDGMNEARGMTTGKTILNEDLPAVQHETHQTSRLRKYKQHIDRAYPLTDSNRDHPQHAAWMTHTIFEALAASPSQIQNLDLANLPWSQCGSGNPSYASWMIITGTISLAFKHLRTLDITIRPYVTDDSGSDSVLEDTAVNFSDFNTRLAECLSSAPMLETLSFRSVDRNSDPILNLTRQSAIVANSDGGYIYDVWDQDGLFQAMKLPRLRSFTTLGLKMRAETFVDWMIRHASKLRDLDSRQILLTGGTGGGSSENLLAASTSSCSSAWDKALAKLAPMIRLESVSLGSMVDEAIIGALLDSRDAYFASVPEDKRSMVTWVSQEDYSDAAARFFLSKGEAPWSSWRPVIVGEYGRSAVIEDEEDEEDDREDDEVEDEDEDEK